MSAPTILECTNPNHDHLDPFDAEGVELEVPRPMVCTHCDAPAHYDTGAELYLHDDPELACWLHPAQIEPRLAAVVTPCRSEIPS